MHTQVKSAFDVSKDPLHQVEMRLARCMHVEAGLLNGMGNVRASECQVLQSARKATILRGIRKKSTISSRQLTPDVNGSGARVALNHPCTLQELDGVLSLRKNHA
jgi:hypothetical protein